MIVKCEQCQTRFRIPDDKVTDKGVKVRCTKCGHTFRVTKDMDQGATGSKPALVPRPEPDTDPFAKFGSVAPSAVHTDPTRPGIFALGVEATRMPPVQPAPAPAAGAFDFSSLAPPPAVTQPEIPAARVPAPFDFSALTAAPPPPPLASPAAPLPPPAALQPPALDFSALAPPPPLPPPPSPAARAPLPAASTPAFDFSSLQGLAPPPLGFTGPDLDPLGLPVGPPPQASPPVPAPAPSSPPAGVHLAFEPPPSTDEFFARPMAAPQAAKPLLDDIPDEASQEDVKSHLFDMPPPPPAPVDAGPASATAATEQVPALVVPPKPVPFSSPSSQTPDPAVRRRTAVGVVVNLLIAAVLVVSLVVVGSALINEGKLTRESLSLDNLKATFAPSTPFPTMDISNGLYETRGGRPVFFVRGEVVNASGGATRVVVRADLVEGAAVVRSASALAGAVPTAEELYDLQAADDLEKLTARIAGRGAPVDPGQSAPFLIAFPEYPADLKAFRVRVQAQADGSGTTAQRP